MEEFLKVAQTVFEAYTGTPYDEANSTHSVIVSEMAKCHKAREGNEGLNSISISGITENFNDFYPKYILVMLNNIGRGKSRVKFL